MVALLILALLALTSSAFGQLSRPALESETENITIDAESVSYDRKTDRVSATGGVVIRRGTTELRADHVDIRRSTGEAQASGGVVLQDSDGVLTAQRVDLNLEDETGSIYEGQVFSERYGYRISGDRIEKGLGQRYRIENGKFTTCNCDDGPPSWSIAGDSVEIELAGYGRLVGGTFNVLDQPILYLPRAIFPVTTQRQSGFLLPRFGVSNRRGFQTIAPFYLVVNRSHDITAAFDVETGARVGLLGQYRYALSTRSQGEIDATYFNEAFRNPGERRDSDPPIPEHRWSVVSEHDQGLPYGGHGYLDLFLVSDDLFLREINSLTVDYGRDVLNRTRRYTESRAGAYRAWERVAVEVEGLYHQDLRQEQALTLQRVPELRLLGQHLFGGLAHATLDLTATGFEREVGIDGFRADIQPGLTIPIPTNLPLHASLNVSLRETAYALTERRMRGGLDPDSEAAFVLELPGQVSRETFRAGAQVGTELSRVYDVGGDTLKRVKHTIEPLLAYSFIPEISQNDLPLFDDVDRVNHRNLVSYGFTTRLLGKYEQRTSGSDESGARAVPSVRELGRLSLFQSYDFERDIGPVGEPPGGPNSDRFSDIDLAVSASPFESTSVLLRSSYDASDNDISTAAVALQLVDPRESKRPAASRLDSRSSATIGYRFITQSILQQLDAALLLHVTDYLGFLYATRYDVQDGRLLENHFGVRLLSQCDCWGLDLALTDKTNPSELEFRVQLTLAGLGSTGDSPGPR